MESSHEHHVFRTTHVTAFVSARLLEPLRDTKTVKQTIMAMIEIHGEVYPSTEADKNL
jgi:hypothetical protein